MADLAINQEYFFDDLPNNCIFETINGNTGFRDTFIKLSPLLNHNLIAQPVYKTTSGKYKYQLSKKNRMEFDDSFLHPETTVHLLAMETFIISSFSSNQE